MTSDDHIITGIIKDERRTFPCGNNGLYSEEQFNLVKMLEKGR